MGVGWAIFMPVINTIVFTLDLSAGGPHRDRVPYPVFRLSAGCCPGTSSPRRSSRRQHARREQEPADQGVLPARGLSFLDDARVGVDFCRRAEHSRRDDDLLPDCADRHRAVSSGAVSRCSSCSRRDCDVAGARQPLLPGREVPHWTSSSPCGCSRRRSSIRRGT